MKKILYAILVFFIGSLKAYGDSIIEPYFNESFVATQSACNARAIELGYAGCALPYNDARIADYVYAANLCANGYHPGELYCGGEPDNIEYISFYYYFSHFSLGDAFEGPSDQCQSVGNPINPVTGDKIQIEPLITLDSIHPLKLYLRYDSSKLFKWSHNYHRHLNFSSQPIGNRFDTLGSAHGFYSPATPEAPLNFGGSINVYGKQSEIMLDTNIYRYLTIEEACEDGWNRFRSKYKYSWINNSVAEYKITPISTFGGVGQCYIYDAPDGDLKMILDIYDLFKGEPSGYPPVPVDFGLNDSLFLRFLREDGSVIVFSQYDGVVNRSQTGETLEITGTGTDKVFRLHTNKDEIEEYSSDGKLVSITSSQGHVQSLTYINDSIPGNGMLYQVKNQTGESLTLEYENYGTDVQSVRIKSITDHADRQWDFIYDPVNYTLSSIDMPDGTTRQYHYEDENDDQLLTGITDERGIRYATWGYDVDGNATMSAHGVSSDVDRVNVSYFNNGIRNVETIRTSATATPLNRLSSYYTNAVNGSPVVAKITGHDPVAYEYNADTVNLDSIEDKGHRTEYGNYDTKGNPGKIIEAVGEPEQRQTNYTYDPRYHSKVATITEASVYPGGSKVTTNQYDDFGNNTAITIDGLKLDGSPVSRTTSFAYNGPFHQLTQIDGPRSDVSDIYTVDYYPDEAGQGNNRARMKRVTAPLDITLYDNITYTGTGKIAGYIDANNVQATLSYYYGNDRLQSLSQLDPNTAENRLTEWTYLATGEVKTITSGNDPADKTTLTFNYDDARRLTSIVDGLGNTIEYVLDSEGNVEQENIRDNTNALKKQLTQTFDDYNRLQLRSQENEGLTETWLPNGTLDKIVDGKNITTDYSYDNLKRLTQINQDIGGTLAQTANTLTILNYDVQDNLTYVKNPVNGETIYSYDDLGNQLTRSSDDTGLTTYSYDDAGNITSMHDANGETTSYTYDALNRLTSTTTSNTADDYQYDYDSCQNGTGRLCKVTNSSSVQHYRYDAFGNVASQQSVQYAYDTADRLQTITYPSGAIIQYDYDAAGQVSQVTLERNGTTVPLAANINYEAFGDISNLLYGNALTLSQSRDSAYRPFTQSILSVFELNYTQYDENGNLTQRDDAITGSNSLFGYDEHNRLKTATGDFGVLSYEYDKNANRTQLTEDAVSTSSSYDPASNRLSMRGVDNAVLDNNGNMLDLGDRGYSYSKHNRLFEVFDGGVLKATYLYNGLGQRISKTLPDGSGKYFIYDTDGKLMAETDINGNILFEYIYLNGQLLAKYTPDNDSDGISNYEEDQQGTNPLSPDNDDDGLSDLDEIFIYGTSISNADTDTDGISDGEEVALNSDPLNSNITIGDINLDGQFNLGDYVLLSQYVLNVRIPTPTEQAQADINQDGILNIQDMLLMQRTLLGLQISWSDFTAENIERIFAQLYQGIIPPAYAAIGDGEIYYVHNDHLGTPVKMTNAFGMVVWQATYDPFGKAMVNEDVDGDGKAVEMNVRFPGQYYDVESGLHYNYFRTYDPELGRYITSDPIGLLPGASQVPNLPKDITSQLHSSDTQEIAQRGLNHTYAYVENNPLKLVDALGLRPMGNGPGPSPQTRCTLQCVDNYLVSWASGAATGAAYGAAGGPGGSVVSALGGMIGRAMNVTATAACIKSCKDDGQCN